MDTRRRPGAYTSGSWYRWIVDGVNRTGSAVVGKTFRSYCSFFCSGNADGEYYDTTIGTSTPAAPVTPGAAYTIANGTGRILAQPTRSTATTSWTEDRHSARGHWTFTPNGDGSYTITNAASRQALGVDSDHTSGRAWGAAPTVTAVPSAGPTVGRQWFVVPGRTADGRATGTVRLVNRYSGLVLALSGAPGRTAETTPTRAWTDTSGSPVGHGRTAPEQTLTLRPVKTAAHPAHTAGRPAGDSERMPGAAPRRR